MKKLLLVAISMMMAFSGFSQALFWDSETPSQKVVLGLRGGVNISNMHVSIAGLGVGLDSKVGYRFGVSADFAIVNSLYINSGLFYSAKGAKGEGSVDGGPSPVDVTFSPAYIELPVYASYRVNFAEQSQLQINFGPYLAYGINGKMKAGNSKENIFGDEGLRRFDAGLGFGAGYTYHRVYFGIEYQLGLANIADTGGFGKITNRNFNISVGYNF